MGIAEVLDIATQSHVDFFRSFEPSLVTRLDPLILRFLALDLNVDRHPHFIPSYA